jgi:hypothetical protein
VGYEGVHTGENLEEFEAGQLLSGQPVRYRKGRRYGPSIMNKITPAGSLSSSQPGGPPCWTSPLAFSLISFDLETSLLKWSLLSLSTVAVQAYARNDAAVKIYNHEMNTAAFAPSLLVFFLCVEGAGDTLMSL